MALPEFNRHLYTQDNEPAALKSIGYYSGDTKLFAAFKVALLSDEWQQLKESRLGVIIKFHELDFEWASRRVHHMLSFQLECKKKHEIWSVVNNHPVRFSLLEFEHITGLNCAYVENLEIPTTEVTEEMKEFWDSLGVHVDLGPSIDELTSACSVAETWDREDRIRLGCLAILAGYIFYYPTYKPIPVNLARLVMDLEDFDNYPWGRVALKTLIEYVKEKDLNKTINIERFVQVLQVWVYYALPQFGREYGSPYPNTPTPPLLAWDRSRGRNNVRKAMLKQTCVQHGLVTKEFCDLFSKWDDDEEDSKIDNILKAIAKQFGLWKWTKKHWSPIGILKTTRAKSESSVSGTKRVIESDQESKKRPRTESESFLDEADAKATPNAGVSSPSTRKFKRTKIAYKKNPKNANWTWDD